MLQPPIKGSDCRKFINTHCVCVLRATDMKILLVGETTEETGYIKALKGEQQV
jgi:hypothetical protein